MGKEGARIGKEDSLQLIQVSKWDRRKLTLQLTWKEARDVPQQ